MKTVAIIQARMGSKRLPGKMMLDLAGQPVLKVIVDRVRAAKRVNQVIVATSLASADVAIERLCLKERIDCYRGSEDDVLDRVYQAALNNHANYIVDITGDCPLVDPRHIDKIIDDLLGTSRSFHSAERDATNPDYAANCWVREWPDGLDIQAYTMAALEKIWNSPKSIREHVGWNIPQHADEFNFDIRQTCAPKRYEHPEWGLTLDEPKDYKLLKMLFAEAVLAYGDHLFPVEFVLDYLLKRPEHLRTNADVVRKIPGKGE